MSTLISRLYDFVTDKANSVKITASRVDGELDAIIVALNRKVLIAASAPADPVNGQTWVDSANNLVKCYLNNTWVTISGTFYIAASAPDSPSEGWLWYDTDNNLLKSYNGSTWDQAGNMIFPASTAQGDLLYLSAASTLARLAKNTDASRVLTNTGTDNNPAWAQVNTAMLKTTTGEVTHTGASAKKALPGGEYGFYPQLKASNTTDVSHVVIHAGTNEDMVLTTSYATVITCFIGGAATLYVQQRYVTASGEDFWLFVQTDKENKIISCYAAPDHPAYGNGGDFDKFPHPFLDYDPIKHNIYLIDPDTIKKIKAEVIPNKSFATIIHEDYKLGDEDLIYQPLHSGKYLTEDKDGKEIQVKEMVKTIPDYIKVRKLVKVNG